MNGSNTTYEEASMPSTCVVQNGKLLQSTLQQKRAHVRCLIRFQKAKLAMSWAKQATARTPSGPRGRERPTEASIHHGLDRLGLGRRKDKSKHKTLMYAPHQGLHLHAARVPGRHHRPNHRSSNRNHHCDQERYT